MDDDAMEQIPGGAAAGPGTADRGDVVEINLLLPARRIDALMALSRRRHESVGQVLRHLIDRALNAEDSLPRARP